MSETLVCKEVLSLKFLRGSLESSLVTGQALLYCLEEGHWYMSKKVAIIVDGHQATLKLDVLALFEANSEACNRFQDAVNHFRDSIGIHGVFAV